MYLLKKKEVLEAELSLTFVSNVKLQGVFGALGRYGGKENPS